MITDRIAQLKKLVKLAPARKEVLKTRLFAHLRAESALASRVIARPASLPAGSWFGRLMSAPAFASALILVLAGGGTAAAAERTRPGDALYSIKVNVNERVVALLSIGAEARARTETRLAERRLIEISELAAGEKLEDALQAKLEERFEAHAAKAQEKIDSLTASGNITVAAEAASRFESSLRAHQAILARVAAASPAAARIAAPLEQKIEAKAQATEKVRASLDEDVKTHTEAVPTGVAAQGRIAAAEQVIAIADLFIDAKRAQLGDEATAAASVKIEQAKVLLAYAESKLAADRSGEAFVAAGDALRTAQHARLLVKAPRPAPAPSAAAVFATTTVPSAASVRAVREEEHEREREERQPQPLTEGAALRGAPETEELPGRISAGVAAGVKIELKENDIESNVETLLNAGL